MTGETAHGLRGDYRFQAIKGKDDAPAFLGRDTRYVHRVYAGGVWMRHFAAAALCLSLSGLLRLAEWFISKGLGGIS